MHDLYTTCIPSRSVQAPHMVDDEMMPLVATGDHWWTPASWIVRRRTETVDIDVMSLSLGRAQRIFPANALINDNCGMRIQSSVIDVISDFRFPRATRIGLGIGSWKLERVPR